MVAVAILPDLCSNTGNFLHQAQSLPIKLTRGRKGLREGRSRRSTCLKKELPFPLGDSRLKLLVLKGQSLALLLFEGHQFSLLLLHLEQLLLLLGEPLLASEHLQVHPLQRG